MGQFYLFLWNEPNISPSNFDRKNVTTYLVTFGIFLAFLAKELEFIFLVLMIPLTVKHFQQG